MTQDTEVSAVSDILTVLKTLLDQVDYQKGNCRINEMIGAVLPPQVLEQARKAIDLNDRLKDMTGLITPSDAVKLQKVSTRLKHIFERDGVADQFNGANDYLARAAIEALGLAELFYERSS